MVCYIFPYQASQSAFDFKTVCGLSVVAGGFWGRDMSAKNNNPQKAIFIPKKLHGSAEILFILFFLCGVCL